MILSSCGYYRMNGFLMNFKTETHNKFETEKNSKAICLE